MQPGSSAAASDEQQHGSLAEDAAGMNPAAHLTQPEQSDDIGQQIYAQIMQQADVLGLEVEGQRMGLEVEGQRIRQMVSAVLEEQAAGKPPC